MLTYDQHCDLPEASISKCLLPWVTLLLTAARAQSLASGARISVSFPFYTINVVRYKSYNRCFTRRLSPGSGEKTYALITCKSQLISTIRLFDGIARDSRYRRGMHEERAEGQESGRHTPLGAKDDFDRHVEGWWRWFSLDSAIDIVVVLRSKKRRVTQQVAHKFCECVTQEGRLKVPMTTNNTNTEYCPGTQAPWWG